MTSSQGGVQDEVSLRIFYALIKFEERRKFEVEILSPSNET